MLNFPKTQGKRMAALWGQSSVDQAVLSAARRTVPRAVLAVRDVEGTDTSSNAPC